MYLCIKFSPLLAMEIVPSVWLLGQELARNEAPHSDCDTFNFVRVYGYLQAQMPHSQRSQRKSVTEFPQLNLSTSIPKMFSVFNWISNHVQKFSLFQRLQGSSFRAISSMTTHFILTCTHVLNNLDADNIRKTPQALSGRLLTVTLL